MTEIRNTNTKKQRPTKYSNIVSAFAIWTMIVAQLNDEKDIAAVLTGVAGSSQLRGVLAGLETKSRRFCSVTQLLCPWLYKHVNMMKNLTQRL